MLSFSVNPLLIFRKKPETWYTIKSGNYNDPSIWTSAGRRFNRLIPRSIDTIVVAHNLTINQNVVITNVYGQTGSIIFDNTARTFDTLNDFYYSGVLNMAGSGTTAHNLILRGINNFIKPSLIINGGGNSITYLGNNQTILDINYFNLRIENQSINTTTFFYFADGLKINGQILASSSTGIMLINIQNSNFISVNNFNNGGRRGQYVFSNNFELRNGSNPILELLTNISILNNLRITTNNQIIATGSNTILNQQQTIIEGVVLQIQTLFGFPTITFQNLIDGTNSSSRLDVMNGVGILSYQASQVPMLTGQFFTNQANNTVNYSRNGNQDVRVPDDGQYRTLIFSGSGAKKLLGNITCNILEIQGTATIDFNGFTITVNNDYIINSVSNLSLSTSSQIIHTGRLILRGTGAKTLTSNRTCSDLLIDNSDATITFAGFILTSTGTSSYIHNFSQRIWASANIIYNNLTIGGTATPNNKTLQGNVSVVGTYIETGNAVRVNNGFTFGNP